MNKLMPVTSRQQGVMLLENYDEMKSYIVAQLQQYKNLAYSEEQLDIAKKDKKELNRIKKAIADTRKSMEAEFLAPFRPVEEKMKELEALIKEPMEQIDVFVKAAEAQEKAEKKATIKKYYLTQAAPIGEYTEQVFESEGFFDEKWLNKTTTAAAWQAEVKTKIAESAKNINSLQAAGGEHTAALIAKYIETQSMEDTFAFRDKLKAAEDCAGIAGFVNGEDNVIGYKILKISGTKSQMEQIYNQLKLLNIEFEEVEDGMPPEPEELTVPDFDSFVAFNIETTGTYGAAAGDGPAEITEIGAVKVENGVVVDRVDWLCNPGRKIVPRIAALTHITDEMVANEPSVAEVIRKFVDYVGELPVVGHNIKSSDLHYICRAAKKAGVAFSSKFFDTYLYAKNFKERNGWDNVKLEYPSDYYGIPQPSAHRAYCDAEANVNVYFKLKEER